jgi:hypothetical protein
MAITLRKWFPVKFSIWNIRGIIPPGRKECTADVFSNISPTIIGFQETKKEYILDSYLKYLVGGGMFAWKNL